MERSYIGKVKLIKKWEVFGPVVQTLEDVKPLSTNGYLYENAMRIMTSEDIMCD